MIPCKSIPTLSLNLIKSFVSLFLHIFQSIIDLFKIIDIYYYYSLLTANGNPENASYFRQVIDEARKADGDYDALMTSWKNIMTFYKKIAKSFNERFWRFLYFRRNSYTLFSCCKCFTNIFRILPYSPSPFNTVSVSNPASIN